jgi:hypothetical protein
MEIKAVANIDLQKKVMGMVMVMVRATVMMIRIRVKDSLRDSKYYLVIMLCTRNME